MNNPSAWRMLQGYAFRPFFLLTGIYGALVILAWVGFLFADLPLELGWSPLHWHSHEMIYGLVPAATAGFILTAVTNWTGAPPLRDRGLMLLVLLWIAGRLAFWLATWLPQWLIAALDLAFLPVLAVYFARVLLLHNNRRNLILVAVLVLLFIGNLLMHIGFINGTTQLIRAGQLLGLNLIALMMVIIAGRITPLFTINWFKNNNGDPDWVIRSPWTDRLAMISVAMLVIADVLNLSALFVGSLALFAGLINGFRLAQWSGWRATSEPLLWILHLAYLWIVAALLLRGASVFSSVVADSLWQHALGAGAMGSLILGVMTRVALGHTGRPLKLPRFGWIIYVAISIAAVVRLAAAANLLDYRLGITLAGISWILAYALFTLIYWPILTSPRHDGKPG